MGTEDRVPDPPGFDFPGSLLQVLLQPEKLRGPDVFPGPHLKGAETVVQDDPMEVAVIETEVGFLQSENRFVLLDKILIGLQNLMDRRNWKSAVGFNELMIPLGHKILKMESFHPLLEALQRLPGSPPELKISQVQKELRPDLPIFDLIGRLIDF